MPLHGAAEQLEHLVCYVRRALSQDDRGAKWAAVAYSLIGTCKLNGINPYEYLADVLRRAPSMPRAAVEAELTPRAWKAAKARESVERV